MTILYSIKAAEDMAEEKKRQALAMAKDYLRDAENSATSAADELVARARTAAREKVAAAEKLALEKRQGLIAERDAQNGLIVERARAKVAKAAASIVGKVVG